MATIYSSKGYPILVDDADYDWLSRFKWTVNDKGYAVGVADLPDGTRRSIPMHRLIMNAPKGMLVDHINHTRHDNRRSNLKVVTPKENQNNLTPQRKMTYDSVTGKYWLLRGDELIGIYRTEQQQHYAWIEANHGGTPTSTNTIIPSD